MGLRVGLTLLLLALCWAERVRYDGHKVYRVTPEKRTHVDWLLKLPTQGLKVDFWKEPHLQNYEMDIQISPEHEDIFLNALEELNIQHRIMVDDVQTLFEENYLKNMQAKALHQSQNPTPRYDFTYYMEYDEMVQYMNDIVAECGSACELISIGTSYEGRDLYVITITNGDSTGKQDVWFDAGIHAREWISPAVNLYAVTELIRGTDPDVAGLLDMYNFHFLPCINPDGYQYTHDVDRMWRKTRKPNNSGPCIGTDANRNFDYMWHTVGTSNDTCSDTWPGDYAFSEPEALAVADFIGYTPDAHNYKLYFTMHTYGQLWMTPWGYTLERPDNYDELMRVANASVESLTAVHGTEYETGQTSHILYGTSGTSRDWANGRPQMDYVYTIELRDEGEYGHELPPEQIIPCSEETWEGIKTMVVEMM